MYLGSRIFILKLPFSISGILGNLPTIFHQLQEVVPSHDSRGNEILETHLDVYLLFA